jgi:hypothetical protein
VLQEILQNGQKKRHVKIGVICLLHHALADAGVD